jgi:hypothetical protein
LRIKLLIERARLDDALLILETVDFVLDESFVAEEDDASEVRTVVGELPEKAIRELPAVLGVRDWRILTEEEEKPKGDWPWSQMPETD